MPTRRLEKALGPELAVGEENAEPPRARPSRNTIALTDDDPRSMASARLPIGAPTYNYFGQAALSMGGSPKCR
jgi:hypothetical protein